MEDEIGTCDTCGTEYDTWSRDGRCGDCGECRTHCTHVKQNDDEIVWQSTITVGMVKHMSSDEILALVETLDDAVMQIVGE